MESSTVSNVFADRTFWQQQRHLITGDADVKFSFVVSIVCALLALSIACTGSLPDCMAIVVAIQIGGNFCNRRPSITPRYFPSSCASARNRKVTELLI